MYESTLLPEEKNRTKPPSVRPLGIKSSTKAAVHSLRSYAKVVKNAGLVGRRGTVAQKYRKQVTRVRFRRSKDRTRRKVATDVCTFDCLSIRHHATYRRSQK